MWPITQPFEWYRLTRRELIRALLGVATYLPARLVLAVVETQPNGLTAPPALKPFLDTLLPEDGTPSATQVGVDTEIIRRMQTDARMRDAIVAGCLWLDQQADTLGAADFAALDAAGRISIVEMAERAPSHTLPRRFFRGVLGVAIRHYYAQPATWPGVGYAGPPQPRGFVDFADPPKGTGA